MTAGGLTTDEADWFWSGDHSKGKRRWTDDLRKVASNAWMRAAPDSESWRVQGEACPEVNTCKLMMINIGVRLKI